LLQFDILSLRCGPNFVNLKRGSEELGVYPYDQFLGRLRSELDGLIAERHIAAFR
jgi:(E)-4-hydroxy-3-methylbut-2-enyl-diphosphate synthase